MKRNALATFVGLALMLGSGCSSAPKMFDKAYLDTLPKHDVANVVTRTLFQVPKGMVGVKAVQAFAGVPVKVEFDKWLANDEFVNAEVKLETMDLTDLKFWGVMEADDAKVDINAQINETGTGGNVFVGTKQFLSETFQEDERTHKWGSRPLFGPGQVRTVDASIMIGLRFTDNDRVLTDDQRDRLNTILKTVDDDKAFAVQAGILKAAAATQGWNYLSILKLGWDLFVLIKEWLDPDETIEDLRITLNRAAGYAPRSTAGASAKPSLTAIDYFVVGEANSHPLYFHTDDNLWYADPAQWPSDVTVIDKAGGKTVVPGITRVQAFVYTVKMPGKWWSTTFSVEVDKAATQRAKP